MEFKKHQSWDLEEPQYKSVCQVFLYPDRGDLDMS